MNGWFVVTATQIYTFSPSRKPSSSIKESHPTLLPSQEDLPHFLATTDVNQAVACPLAHLLIVIFICPQYKDPEQDAPSTGRRTSLAVIF